MILWASLRLSGRSSTCRSSIWMNLLTVTSSPIEDCLLAIGQLLHRPFLRRPVHHTQCANCNRMCRNQCFRASPGTTETGANKR